MNLGDFLTNASSIPPAPQEPVEFVILHTDQMGETRKIPVNASLACMTEKTRAKCLREALVHCRKEYPDGIPSTRLEEEEQIQMLSEALRDADDPRKAFSGATQLRSVLTTHERTEIWARYESFMAREFPASVTAEEFQKLVEDASKKSLPALLSSTEFSKIQRALPALVYYFATHPTPTSSDSEPA